MKNMKNLKRFILLLVVVGALVGCKNDDSNEISFKKVVYSVKMKYGEDNAKFSLNVTYTDENGKIQELKDQALPWSKEIRVPSSTKIIMKGNLTSLDSRDAIHAVIRCIVTDENKGIKLLNGEKDVDLEKSSKFSVEEIIKETSFSFQQ